MLTFRAFVDDAGVFVLENQRQFRAAVAEKFKGRTVTVTVARETRKRSLAQNAWLWGVALPLIAEYLGYDHHEHERLHYDLLSVRFGTVAVAPLVDGAQPRIVPKKTSSELTTAEFTEYMEWLLRFAADKWGVVLPLPDERQIGASHASV
jgi:hypothetical protein